MVAICLAAAAVVELFYCLSDCRWATCVMKKEVDDCSQTVAVVFPIKAKRHVNCC